MSFFERSGVRIGCLAMLALLVSACGGGDDKSSSAQTAPPPGGNAPPTIQGQPGTSVVAGQSYSFQPAASDPNNDRLTFSATNLPRWASMNAATGRLTGTPTSADVATYSGITITVSDGTASASLAAFAIAVTDIGNGTATLSWLPPTRNSDGSALTDLAGYQVNYGRSENDLGQTVSLTNPSINTYVIENLSTGTWYFAVMAVNRNGVTSSLSNLAFKTIS